MKLKSFFTATITATLLATASLTQVATAQTTDPVVQSIVTDLSTAGYMQIHVTMKANKIEVTASGPNGIVERSYSYAGVLLEEEVKPGMGAGAGRTGLDGTGDDLNGEGQYDGGDRDGDHGGDRDGDHGGDRDGDHGGDRDGDHGGDRDDDHGGDRDDDHGGDRDDDHGGDRDDD